jgi:hypothetical protein
VSRWKLTVRHGSEVDSEGFDSLGSAVEALRARALSIRSEGPVERSAGFHDYEPADQVHARLQLSGGGLLRKQVAGIDVRGDGNFVPFRGGVGRTELEPSHGESPFETVRETLAGES